jgi:hypothetical protein
MVFEWFKRFKDGREELQDDPKRGVPQHLEVLTQL